MNSVDMIVIMLKIDAANTPISTHTWGSVIVSIPSLSSGTPQNARGISAHPRSVDDPDSEASVAERVAYTEALSHPPVFTRQPSVAKRASI